MKNKIRVVVYSALALPLLVLAIFALSLAPAERACFFADLKQNTIDLLHGDVEAVGLLSSRPRSRRGGARSYSQYGPEAVFARLDKDNDGKLTDSEIGKRLRDHMERLDKDKNGAMSPDEFRFGMQTAYSSNR